MHTNAIDLKKKMGGFTLIELGVVIVILVLLAAFFAQNLWRSREDTQVGVVNTFLMSDIPRAIAAYQSRTGSLLDISADKLAERGVPITTQFGEQWTIVGTNVVGGIPRAATVTYPITEPANSDVIREDVVSAIQRVIDGAGAQAANSGLVESVNNTGGAVVIIYRGE